MQNGSIVLYSDDSKSSSKYFFDRIRKGEKRVLRKNKLLTSLGMGNAIDQALESQTWHIQWGIEMVEYRLRWSQILPKTKEFSLISRFSSLVSRKFRSKWLICPFLFGILRKGILVKNHLNDFIGAMECNVWHLSWWKIELIEKCSMLEKLN